MSTCAQCRAANQQGSASCWNCGITLSGVETATAPGTGSYAAAPVQDPMIGRHVLDQYVIRSRIADGGMGALYLAEQPSIGRHAVIKLVHPWLARDPTISKRFGTEARAAARLQNPHIVSIYNYGRMNDGTLFIAMEHITGCTLGELIRAEGRLEPARTVSIATQICEALSEAHRRGIIHRDLKPSNIMMVSRGGGSDFVKVLDFGIASLEGSETPSTGKIVGTPRYMAPELVTGGTPDARSDIYTLALIIYEMLTGRSPFVADSPAEYMSKHLNEMPPPVAQMCPGLIIPPALDACLMRALAKAPHQRPQSADKMADELWSALMATAMNADLPLPEPRRKRSPSRAGRLAIAASLVSAGALSVAGYAFWSTSGEVVSDPTVATATPATTEPDAAEENEPRPAPLPAWLSFGAPNPEKQELMKASISELEAELERVTLLSGLSRESISLSLREYRRAVTNPPDGVDPELYHKALLAELIIRWRASRVDAPPPDRSLDELEAVFLTMQSRFDVQTRRRMLHRLKNKMADEPNPEVAVKRTVMEWISDYGGVGQHPDSDEEEIPEILEEDEDGDEDDLDLLLADDPPPDPAK